jgi:hypothetical protein
MASIETMSARAEITFGNRVRIRTTPQATAAGLAGELGEVRGETTPSVTGVDVIGSTESDRALHVHVDHLDRGAWFSVDMLEFIDHGPGTVITLDGVGTQWKREPTGEWVESKRVLPPREWWPWLRRFVKR